MTATKPSDFNGDSSSVTDTDSKTISYNREYTYHYFALKTNGTASSEYTNNTGYSNLAVVTTTKDANIPQVTGLKAEKKADGSYDLVWNPVDAEVVIYAYEKETLPEFFNLKLLNAKSSPTVIGENVTASTTLEYKLTSLQKKLIKKVQSATGNGMDARINTEDFDNIKPGVTYYFTAFTYDTINRNVDQAPIASIDGVNFTRYTNFSQASSSVSIKASLEKPLINTLASQKSVKLTLSGKGNPTGYQIYRQNSKKKWSKIATTTDDVYTDSNLKQNTKYSYRVRAYDYDKDTKKTVYSDYAYKTVSTTITSSAPKIKIK